MDKQEIFIRAAARERIKNNKTKKVQSIFEHQELLDQCVETCIRAWKQGDKSAVEALRKMEDEAKTMCRKLT